jgi:hypothetical protein
MKYQNRDQYSANRTATPATFGNYVIFAHGAERLNITVDQFSERVKSNGFEIVMTREGEKMISRADALKMGVK